MARAVNWTAVGVFVAALGVVATVVIGLASGGGWLYDRISEPHARLEARASYSSLAHPERLSNQYEKFHQALRGDTFLKRLLDVPRPDGVAIDEWEETVRSLRNTMMDHLSQHATPNSYIGSPQTPNGALYDGVWYITVTNSGNATAEAVTIQVPDAVISERSLDWPPGAGWVEGPGGTIALGNLRPAQEESVYVWVHRLGTPEAPTVVHESGVVPVVVHLSDIIPKKLPSALTSP